MYKPKYGMEDIIKWHKETFPKATLEGQKKKFEEEFREFEEAITHKGPEETCEELADMYIVAMGEARFNAVCGFLSLGMINHIITEPFLSNDSLNSDEKTDGIREMLDGVMRAVDKKMKVNEKRKWTYKDGQYKHVKEKEESNVHVIKGDSIDDILEEIRKVIESSIKDTKDVQDS